MTPQTKIGLLLSLAFMIVVGILLSEQVTQSTQPPVASLSGASNGVNASVRTPADTAAPIVRLADATLPAPRETFPQPVAELPSREELEQPPVVELASSGAVPPIEQTVMANAGVTHPVEIIARQLGEAVEAVAPPTEIVRVETQQPAPARNEQPVKAYVVQKGDSLSKIAQNQLGSDTPANRQAIIALNPSLQKNPDLLIAGREYTLPLNGAPAAAQTVAVAEKPKIAEKPKPAEPRTYVVQPNDSLWLIASREVGNASAIATIKELNKGRLGDSDVIQPGMKLVLPAKNQ